MLPEGRTLGRPAGRGRGLPVATPLDVGPRRARGGRRRRRDRGGPRRAPRARDSRAVRARDRHRPRGRGSGGARAPGRRHAQARRGRSRRGDRGPWGRGRGADTARRSGRRACRASPSPATTPPTTRTRSSGAGGTVVVVAGDPRNVKVTNVADIAVSSRRSSRPAITRWLDEHPRRPRFRRAHVRWRRSARARWRHRRRWPRTRGALGRRCRRARGRRRAPRGGRGLPDLGTLFPASDEEYRGVSSIVLLRDVAAKRARRRPGTSRTSMSS